MDTRSDAPRMRKSLAESFGLPVRPSDAPAEMLVQTILSQNTNDTNRDRAYASLIDRFGTLAAVAEADEDEIARAIRVGGLHRQKAKTIRAALGAILGRCEDVDLSFLAELPTTEALTWLSAIPGIGPKTAGIVLLFAFGRPVFPVDTHIRRVLTRVGWLAETDDPHKKLNRVLPKDPLLMADLHLLLIQLGRALCHPRSPRCNQCPILRDCRHGSQERQEAE